MSLLKKIILLPVKMICLLFAGIALILIIIYDILFPLRGERSYRQDLSGIRTLTDENRLYLLLRKGRGSN